MGLVVNKSFEAVRKDIAKKAEKLQKFLFENNGYIWGDWTVHQSKVYDRLAGLCDNLCEEISKLDEIEDVPEFEKHRK